ncbi:hypothetical protein H632_c397p1 [Helicosporidium sp. ATCC 50920]|nr:hypothetical protein H632_c397p1 [Helicosporidium sp. ATCC 50920]|eukprot:KDD76012.1 hypothetical protein H632_c397p1 [Helicosporidium sp. ATCC 50920]
MAHSNFDTVVCCARQRGGVGDEDYQLAKLLQEQERAFLALVSASSTRENFPPRSPVQRGTSASPRPEAGLSDEEMARRLQQEEEAEFERRLHALAGVGRQAEGSGEDQQESEAPTLASHPSHPVSSLSRHHDALETMSDGPDVDEMGYEQLTVLGEVAGSVICGLSAEALAALPRVPFQGDEQEQCSVCCCEFEPAEEVVALPCAHVFHAECIQEWLLRSKRCPLCHVEVDEGGAPGRGQGGGRVLVERQTA